MQSNTIEKEIQYALNEAKILEYARERYDVNHMLYTAQKLSNAPFSFVKHVYESKR